MRVRYFTDTDTLLIEFRDATVRERRDLDENTLLDPEADGNICSITIGHASKRTDAPRFSFAKKKSKEGGTSALQLTPNVRRHY